MAVSGAPGPSVSDMQCWLVGIRSAALPPIFFATVSFIAHSITVWITAGYSDSGE